MGQRGMIYILMLVVYVPRTTMSEEGDYRICWDNTFSHFNSKTVFFGVVIENENEDDEDLWDDGFDSSVTAEDIYEMKVEDIKVSRRQDGMA